MSNTPVAYTFRDLKPRPVKGGKPGKPTPKPVSKQPKPAVPVETSQDKES